MPSILYARFRTGRRFYIYDTYSNQILDTPPEVWAAIDDAVAAEQNGRNEGTCASVSSEFRKAQDAGYLRPCDIEHMQFYPTERALRERINNHISHLTLEVTERCNNRCRYCAYSYDGHRVATPKDMPEATALNALDFFLSHSGGAENRNISFWGGEPLLKFSFIQSIVRHVRERVTIRAPTFQFTTNATRIDREIADFLAGHDIALLISLDGPERVHDLHRVDASGRGTFTKVIKGLECLRATDEEYYRRRVKFNCVVARTTDLTALVDFFDNHPVLRGQHVMFSPASSDVSRCPEEYGGLSDIQRRYISSEVEALFGEAPRGALADLRDLVWKSVRRIAMRRRQPVGDTVSPNGCCVPLLKKMHVTVDGDVYLCEQVPHTNSIGNVNEGIDLERAVSLVGEYVRRSLPECSRCWAVRLCSACYQQFMREFSWDESVRKRECDRQKDMLVSSLRHYTAILEQVPEAFDRLREVEVVAPV